MQSQPSHQNDEVLAATAAARCCVKCPSGAGEFWGLDPRRAVYCRSCFIRFVRHKFALALGKHRVFRSAGGGQQQQPEWHRALLLWDGVYLLKK